MQHSLNVSYSVNIPVINYNCNGQTEYFPQRLNITIFIHVDSM